MQTPRRRRVALASAVGAAVWAMLPTCQASDTVTKLAALCPPSGSLYALRLINDNTPQQATCDASGLKALPQRELVTSLPASLGQAGAHHWQGVSLRWLAERMGGTPGSTLRLVALNDYAISVPWSDLVRYDPIVAYQRNGVALSVREKGPMMLIYPFDAHPTLDTQQYLNRSIWHIQAITFK